VAVNQSYHIIISYHIYFAKHRRNALQSRYKSQGKV